MKNNMRKLSAIQQSYLSEKNEYSTDPVGCHTYTEFKINSNKITIDDLTANWNKLVKIHPMLRMSINENGFQCVHEYTPYRISCQTEKELPQIRSELAQKVYKMDESPLYDLRYVKTEKGCLLCFSVDSLIMDAYSARLLFEQLNKLCVKDCKEQDFIESISYFQWLDYKKNRMLGDSSTPHITYWQNKIQKMNLSKNPFYSRERNETNLRSRSRLSFDSDESLRVLKYCKQNSILPDALFGTSIANSLYVYLKCNSLNIVSTLANRAPVKGVEPSCVGPLTNTLITTFCKEKSLLDLSNDMYHNLDNSDVDLPEILSKTVSQKIFLPIVLTVDLSEESIGNSSFQEQFSVSQTPGVELEIIVSMINKHIVIDINYSKRYITEADVKEFELNFKNNIQKIVSEKKVTKYALSNLQSSYAIPMIDDFKSNHVIKRKKFPNINLSSLKIKLDAVKNKIGILGYEFENFKLISTNKKIPIITSDNNEQLFRNSLIVNRPVVLRVSQKPKYTEITFIFNMTFLDASSIFWVFSALCAEINGKKLIASNGKTESLIADRYMPSYWSNKFEHSNNNLTVSDVIIPKLRQFRFGLWHLFVEKCKKMNCKPDSALIATIIQVLQQKKINNNFFPVVTNENPNINMNSFKDSSFFSWIESSKLSNDLMGASAFVTDTMRNDQMHFSPATLENLSKKHLLPQSNIVITNCLNVNIDIPEHTGYSISSNVLVDIVIMSTPMGLYLEWNYNNQVFSEVEIKSVENALKRKLLDTIENKLLLEDKEKTMPTEYSVPQMRAYLQHNSNNLSKENFKQIIYDFNNTEKDYHNNVSMFSKFSKYAIDKPDSVAIVTDETQVTYKELNSYSDIIAKNLIGMQKAVSNKKIIGVAMTRSVNMIATLIGIQKAGYAYLPLNIEDGEKRIQEIIKSAELDCIVTDLDNRKLTDLRTNIVIIDELMDADRNVDIALPAVSGEELAYVIFTSGSTGKPKGVPIKHESAINLFHWIIPKLKLTAGDRVLAVNPINFDLSVFDIFGTLSFGGTVRMLSSDDRLNVFKIVEILENEQITIWNSAPAYFKILLNEVSSDEKIFSSLRHVLLSGDWIPTNTVEYIDKYFPNAKLLALGGATEATIWSNFYDFTEAQENIDSVPYGKPISNTKYYVLNKDLCPCPIGQQGDLYISGMCLTGGYLNLYEKNKETFLKNPFEDGNGKYSALYKTGDIAYYTQEGILIFCGRSDYQIEINGFRVELGEVEAALTKIGLNDSVSVENAGKIISFTTSKLSKSELNDAKEKTKEYLSEYMVPSDIISLPIMPMTKNGKVDRAKLKVYAVSKKENQITIPASGKNQIPDIKNKLLTICTEILGSDIDSNQFSSSLGDLGFGSLQFTLLSTKIKKNFTVKINPALFYKYDSINKIVDYIEDELHLEDAQKVKARSTPISKKESQNSKYSDEDIVIVSVSARMPDAKDEIEFFNNLITGENSVREIPRDRWSWEKYYGEKNEDGAKTKVNLGHFMKQIDQFDRKRFNISPKEADAMDPRQRILLEETGNLLQKSGYKFKELSGEDIGVFLGATGDEYYNLLINGKKEITPYSLMGTSRTLLANRISYFYNWNGPSEVIDTACSSSLFAMHNAILALKNGDCSRAVVGGINVILDPLPQISLDKIGMLASDGNCKTLERTADGYGRGEGVGMILLESFKTAKENGDTVLAVVKNSQVNHGGKANSLTAPNIPAQVSLIKRAYRKEAVDTSNLRYIELHGTGTSLGDPIEIEALKEAFSEQKLTNKQVGIGSVKTSVGHLEAAAGMASIIKAVLAFNTGVFPGSINTSEKNENIELEDSPFYTLGKNENMPFNEEILIGISSFGFGGANGHIVLGGAVNVK